MKILERLSQISSFPQGCQVISNKCLQGRHFNLFQRTGKIGRVSQFILTGWLNLNTNIRQERTANQKGNINIMFIFSD